MYRLETNSHRRVVLTKLKIEKSKSLYYFLSFFFSSAWEGGKIFGPEGTVRLANLSRLTSFFMVM